MAQVLEFTDYRSFLKIALNELGKSLRGARSRLAEHLDVRPGYISQVLNGQSDLTPEVAARACAFFSLTDEEAHYFVLLVSHERAGNADLKRIYQRQIREHQEQYLNMKKRFKVKEALSASDQHIYYSSWQYAAIHAAVSNPRLQTREAIAGHFRLGPGRISEILDFLARTGIIQCKGGKYQPGNRWVHLGKESALASKNHVNWRLEAIRSLENQRETDLHYSSVIGISEKDIFAIRAKLVKTLEEVREVIKESADETVCSLLIDFFKL